MGEERKPCPFCGGAATAWGAEKATCERDGCPANEWALPIKNWNQRVPEDRLRAEVERLRALYDDLAAADAALRETYEALCVERNALKAEVERLEYDRNDLSIQLMERGEALFQTTLRRQEADAEVARLRDERTLLIDALAGLCGERDPKTLREMALLLVGSTKNATACNVLADALEEVRR